MARSIWKASGEPDCEFILAKGFGKHIRLQGGSTIEQQLAKHLIGNFSQNPGSKGFGILCCRCGWKKISTKDKILTYYMNRIYFGNNYYGVGAAAKGYFGKDVKDLTVPECALLAGHHSGSCQFMSQDKYQICQDAERSDIGADAG